jgi:hypothetical protein
MRILTSSGIEDVELQTSRARSTVGNYWNAVRRYLWTGKTDELEQFSGTRIRNGRY